MKNAEPNHEINTFIENNNGIVALFGGQRLEPTIYLKYYNKNRKINANKHNAISDFDLILAANLHIM